MKLKKKVAALKLVFRPKYIPFASPIEDQLSPFRNTLLTIKNYFIMAQSCLLLCSETHSTLVAVVLNKFVLTYAVK